MAAILFSFLMGLYAPSANLPQRDVCKIYGVIYETNDPREAHFRVYEEASDAFAHIIVYEQENRLYANAPGNWTFTKTRNLADYTLYFVEDRRDADFGVYFTEFESFAGCNR